MTLRVVVLISGTGSNLEALLGACDVGLHGADVVAVGADREAAGLEFARRRGIETFVEQYEVGERAAWSRRLAAEVASHRPDLVVLSGLMRVLPAQFVAEFSPMLINTHPAYLPEFPGAHGVADALAAGVSQTGATIHIVDPGVDSGPIIDQVRIPIHSDDDVATLHERIKVAERRLLITTVSNIAAGRLDLHAVSSPTTPFKYTAEENE